jgi:hypothetical protein
MMAFSVSGTGSAVCQAQGLRIALCVAKRI